MWALQSVLRVEGHASDVGRHRQVRLDGATDYVLLRCERFDTELAPRPQSRRAEADNRGAVRVVRWASK
jgi:hypothetical protein